MNRARSPHPLLGAVLLLIVGLPAAAATADSTPQLVIRDQRFVPDALTIPAGRSVRILVSNEDAIPAELESYDFNREQVIPGHTEIPIFVGPLEPGTYGFFNDFHPDSKGKLVVEPAAQ